MGFYLATFFSLLALSQLVSCGPPPGGGQGTYQQAGIAANVPPQDQAQRKLQDINRRINEGNSEDQELSDRLDSLRSQIGQTQAAISQTQSSTQNEITQKTDTYAARDLQVQEQQLELDMARSKLESQIQEQKSNVANVQSLVAQEQSWGFDSPDLIANTAKLQGEQQKLSALENQYWATQRQSAAISSLQNESRSWGESVDRSRVEQSSNDQYNAQLKQLQKLQAQYDDLSDEQTKLRHNLGELDSEYRHGQATAGTG